MSIKPIVGFLTITKDLPDGSTHVVVEGSNLAFRGIARRRVLYFWNNNANSFSNQTYVQTFPWKNGYLLADDDLNIGHGAAFSGNYPSVAIAMNSGTTADAPKLRQTGSVATINSAALPRTFGSVMGIDGGNSSLTSGYFAYGDNVVAQVDVPLDYTQFTALPFRHPAYQQANQVTTSAGLNYVTYTNSSFWDQTYLTGNGFHTLRIESGADAGFYLIQHNDPWNNRLYLLNLDGSIFAAQSTGSFSVTAGPGRRAFFNESGIIPLGIGTLASGGRFNPRKTDPMNRDSYVLKIVNEKTGSTEAAVGTEQQGSYYISAKAFTHGDGALSGSTADINTPLNNSLSLYIPANLSIPWFNYNPAGGCQGMALDWDNQRLWVGYTDVSNHSGIAHWRYKTTESFREVSNYLGTAAQGTFVTPAIALSANDVITNLEMGSNTGSAKNWCFISIWHATGGHGGLAVIKPDLTTLQYFTTSGSFPLSTVGGATVDKSRTRVGTAGNASTNGANQITSVGGAFTNADVGRAILLTGAGADSGTYKISTVVSATQVQVTTLAGAGVTFTSQSGGTFEIGDRVYFFFGDNTTSAISQGAGKVNYMEALAPGVWHTRTVSMTNGSNISIRTAGGTALRYGQRQLAFCDQVSGAIFWASRDVAQQINKYDPLTNTHSKLAIADVQTPAQGAGLALGSITGFTAIHVNSKFPHIWVGTDAGQLRLSKTYGLAPPTAWAQSTVYAPGDVRLANGNVYTCVTGGTSLGTGTGPLTTRKFITDNTVVWAFTEVLYRRFFSDGSTTKYQNPAGYPRETGEYLQFSASNYVRQYFEMPDGRMYACLQNSGSASNDIVVYSPGSDCWSATNIGQNSGNGNEVFFRFPDPYGRIIEWIPSSGNAATFQLGAGWVDYQWDSANSKWIPLEFVPQGLPNKSTSDTTNPYGNCRPIHSTAQEALWGVTIAFNRQGGATPPNNEFLGRAGLSVKTNSQTTSTDGSTTSGSANFGGAGFAVGDVGRTLRIESGVDYGLYVITAFINGNSVTLKNINGTAFSASATAASLTYSLWDYGTPGSNAGPEDATMLLSDGFGKDNTQDISGISFENYLWKTVSHENDESRKFCVPTPLAVPGSITTKVYATVYAQTAISAPSVAGTQAAISHHLALPGAEFSTGREAMDWMIDKFLDGTGAKPTFLTNSWWGANYATNIGTGSSGLSVDVDFGKDVEVGFVQIRFRENHGSNIGSVLYTAGVHGNITNLYKANNAGGAPVDSTTLSARCTGASLTLTASNNTGAANSQTINVTSGNFLGTAGTSFTGTGSFSAGASQFIDSTNPFSSADIGKVIGITSGAESGNFYRILSFVSSSTVVVRNLDQTAKLWGTSNSGINWTMYPTAVREDDLIQVAVQSTITAVQKLCVERLTNPTTAQVRLGPSQSGTGLTWSCFAPTWTPVKRLSYSTEALPPDVQNNGTWGSMDGREASGGSNDNDTKMYMDLTTSELTSAGRTGRWWRFASMPRFNGNAVSGAMWLSNIEFYDTSGNKLAVSKYTLTDQARTNSDFFFNHINRFDFIQAANDAQSGVAGFNGNADLGGANGDTITLTTGGNKFLGFQVRPPITDIVTVAGVSNASQVITSATAAFTTADVGRIVHVTTGADAGYYRISARNSSTSITVVLPSGTGNFAFTGTSAQTANFHEGINAGGSSPDKFMFLSDLREFTILSINNAMDTITINETLQPARTNRTWEIRRPGYDTSSATTEATKTARLTRPYLTYPVQSGDMCHDSRGHYRFFSEDVGTGYQRTGGSAAGGNNIFTGTGFNPDDVGRLLFITTGTNVGIWEIASYTNATTITVKNHYTGAAATLAADAAMTYQVIGDRRFIVTKYVVGLRA